MTKVVSYKRKVDWTDLEEMELCVIDNEEETVTNRLQEILDEKGFLISDLARLTGVSRQSINAVIRNKMKPSIEFVLKVSHVLGIDQVDGIFSLTDDAWVQPYRHNRDITIYINMVDMTLVDTKQKRYEISQTGYEYYHIETKEMLSKDEYENRLRNYVDSNLEDYMKTYREEGLSMNRAKSKATEVLRKEFNAIYHKIYKMVGTRIEPIVVK